MEQHASGQKWDLLFAFFAARSISVDNAVISRYPLYDSKQATRERVRILSWRESSTVDLQDRVETKIETSVRRYGHCLSIILMNCLAGVVGVLRRDLRRTLMPCLASKRLRLGGTARSMTTAAIYDGQHKEVEELKPASDTCDAGGVDAVGGT